MFKIYTELLQKGRHDMKNIVVVLNIMLVISASAAAAAESGFSKLNIEKTSLHTRLKSKFLSSIMHSGVENIPVTKFDSWAILKRWLKKGKWHIRGHKTKNKEELTELTTSEEQLFIDMTS